MKKEDKVKLIIILFNVVTIILSGFALLINWFIIYVHRKVKLFRIEFFQVVFGIAIVEFMIYFIMFIDAILNLIFIDDEDRMSKIQEYMCPIFDIFFTMLLSYLIVVIIFIYSKSISYDKINDAEVKSKYGGGSDSSGHQYSVVLLRRSYYHLHLISILCGLVHAGIVIALQNFVKQIFITMEYLTFIKGDMIRYPKEIQNHTSFFSLLLHIPTYFLIGFSIYYLKKSWDKTKVSDKYLIKSFGVNCFVISFLSLTSPVAFVFTFFTNVPPNDNSLIITNIVLTVAFQILIIKNVHYRITRYYIQSILGFKTPFCHKIKEFFRVFSKKEIKEPDFVDFNSMFIYHALLSMSDFMDEDLSQQLDDKGDPFKDESDMNISPNNDDSKL